MSSRSISVSAVSSSIISMRRLLQAGEDMLGSFGVATLIHTCPGRPLSRAAKKAGPSPHFHLEILLEWKLCDERLLMKKSNPFEALGLPQEPLLLAPLAGVSDHPF